MVSKYPQQTIAEKVAPTGGGFLDSQSIPAAPKELPAPFNNNPLATPAQQMAEIALPQATKWLKVAKGIVAVVTQAEALEKPHPELAPPLYPKSDLMPAAHWNRTACGTRRGGETARRNNSSCTSFCAALVPGHETFPPPGGLTSWTSFVTFSGPYSHGSGGDPACLGTTWWAHTRYDKKVGSPTPTPTTARMPMIVGDPVATPVHDPVMPVAWPQEEPKTAPWTKPNPETEPSNKPKAKPGTKPVSVPTPHFPDLPVVFINPSDDPTVWQWAPPTVVIETGNGGVTTTIKPNDAANKPPPKPTKQFKTNVGKVGGKLWVALNMFTEGLDFIEVLWDALPDKCKRKYVLESRYGNEYKYHTADIQSKMEDVYNCADHIDWQEAIVGYVNNSIEDWFYGVQGIPTKKVSQLLGINTGLDAAIADAQKWAQHKAVNEEGEEQYTIDELIPTIDYDPKTGDVKLVSIFGDVTVWDTDTNAVKTLLAD